MKITLKEAREASKMTQNELAGKVGVDRVQVSQWENNQVMPRRNHRATLEAVFGVPLNWDENLPLDADETLALGCLCKDTVRQHPKEGPKMVGLLLNMDNSDIRRKLRESGYCIEPLGLPTDPRVISNASCGGDGPLDLPVYYTPKR